MTNSLTLQSGLVSVDGEPQIRFESNTQAALLLDSINYYVTFFDQSEPHTRYYWHKRPLPQVSQPHRSHE